MGVSWSSLALRLQETLYITVFALACISIVNKLYSLQHSLCSDSLLRRLFNVWKYVKYKEQSHAAIYRELAFVHGFPRV